MMTRDEAKTQMVDMAVQNINDTVSECQGLPDTCETAPDLIWPNISSAIDSVDPEGRFQIAADELWDAVISQTVI
jgi:hypothetical protein